VLAVRISAFDPSRTSADLLPLCFHRLNLSRLASQSGPRMQALDKVKWSLFETPGVCPWEKTDGIGAISSWSRRQL
jgi:hypothetical protein